jgi:tetratricopeptide (TPR) repeat protein
MTAETRAPEPPSDPSALASFEEGRAAFLARDLETAHQAFSRAHRKDTRNPRYMSWYGVTLVLVDRNLNLGAQLCEQALRSGGVDPELLLNQARVHLALNQRDRAVRSVSRGLELWPEDPRLCAARDALGTRRDPVVPFLGRKSPLNRLLGRLRHRWRQRTAPVYELSPVALGVPIAADAPDEGRGAPPDDGARAEPEQSTREEPGPPARAEPAQSSTTTAPEHPKERS